MHNQGSYILLPISGAAVAVHPDSKGLADIEEGNRLHVLKKFMSDELLPDNLHRWCRLSATLTDRGDISVAFEALSKNRIIHCTAAAKELVEVINNPIQELKERTIITRMGAAALTQTASRYVMDNMKETTEKAQAQTMSMTGEQGSNTTTQGGASSRYNMSALSLFVTCVSVTVSFSMISMTL